MAVTKDFYSHAPRGARRADHHQAGNQYNFYSHAPRGARRRYSSIISLPIRFLLTRPSRGATFIPKKEEMILCHFYSHAPRGARPLHLACNSESFPTYRGADFFIIKSARFCRFVRYLMPLFQANLPEFLHHLFFPYHFIHAGTRNTK